MGPHASRPPSTGDERFLMTPITFPHLSAIPGVAHGIFTRQGGVSRPPFDTLNTSLSGGDDPRAVQINRRKIQLAVGAPALIFPRQVHGCRVATLMDGNPSASPLEADALVTQRRGIFLAIQVADCQAIVMADPEKRVIANIHAGWRGSIQNIVGRTVEIMAHVYGCRPDHIKAAIGPSLGPCCAEFVHYQQEIPQKYWSYKDGRDHFDFWAITRDQLIATGVPNNHILSSDLCTQCRPEQFFSYRRTKVTGRFVAVIGLR